MAAAVGDDGGDTNNNLWLLQRQTIDNNNSSNNNNGNKVKIIYKEIQFIIKNITYRWEAIEKESRERDVFLPPPLPYGSQNKLEK